MEIQRIIALGLVEVLISLRRNGFNSFVSLFLLVSRDTNIQESRMRGFWYKTSSDLTRETQALLNAVVLFFHNPITMSKLEELLKFHNARLARELEFRTTVAIVAESSLTVFVALCAFLGNMLVCVAIARNSRLHTPTNVLILALAMTDITMSIATMPLTVGVLISGRWIYSKEVCQFQGSFPLTLAVISLQLMVVISVNRYLCVANPNLYRRVFTTKKSIGFAIGVICFACFPTLSPMLYAREGYMFHPGKACCAFAMEQNFIFALCMGLAFIISPFIIMSCLYFRIYFSVRRVVFPQGSNSNARARSESDKNIGRCSCWLLMLLASYYGHQPNRHEQWSTNASQAGLLFLWIVDLHFLSHKSSLVRSHEPLVPRGIQKDDHLQEGLTFFLSTTNLHCKTQR